MYLIACSKVKCMFVVRQQQDWVYDSLFKLVLHAAMTWEALHSREHFALPELKHEHTLYRKRKYCSLPVSICALMQQTC